MDTGWILYFGLLATGLIWWGAWFLSGIRVGRQARATADYTVAEPLYSASIRRGAISFGGPVLMILSILPLWLL